MAGTDDRWEALRAKLDGAHRWPCPYTLKCIIVPARLEEVRAVLEGHELALRDSSGGKYQSVTTTFTARDAGHVIGIYRRLSVIEGIILL
jgi:putative lipoic acid-binding regulatory protein